MNARDELAALLKSSGLLTPGESYTVADAVLAAGYRKPRTLTTAEELDALPFESVIRDSSGCVLERWGGPNEHIWASPAIAGFVPRGDISFPAVVLHEGAAA